MCAENYQNRDRFDKDIAKLKQGSFFASHGIINYSKWPTYNHAKTLRRPQKQKPAYISMTSHYISQTQCKIDLEHLFLL